MNNPPCALTGADFPLFAFSHCRDVVVAVSKAGGFGVFGAAKTPPAIVARLNSDLSALMKESDLRDRLIAQGAEPLSGPPEDLRKYLAGEIEKWGKVIKASGAKPD